MTKIDQSDYDTLGVSQKTDQLKTQALVRKLNLKYRWPRNQALNEKQTHNELSDSYPAWPNKGISERDNLMNCSGFIHNTFYPKAISIDTKASQKKGRDIEIRASVSLEKIASGGNENITINRQVTCKSCKGTGVTVGSFAQKCSICKGTGKKVIKKFKKTTNLSQEIISCPACHGSGRVIKTACHYCKGRGKQAEQEVLTFKIPKGASDGSIIKLPRRGEAAIVPSLPSGDLYICIASCIDQRFQRRGADLWYAQRIDIVDAVLGTEIKVPTLDGYTKFKIPPGTQINATFKIKEKGLPFENSDQHGDLNIRIILDIPTHISDSEKFLYKKLRAQQGKIEYQ